ncbi:fumarylacetoacetate hydrolase family protein [Chitinasiproducens palmae]|uniref:2-keto-4-pentenoate hydratase/2-oxohepta-3-ene-1,7-dioic acid hydratase (Catechol pathway) n=1 Tax=Chitinasiproducens palmae TaxID=1770053 RepID=A0A1H2PK79_9BURK|nr:fumarylacetoacetate hydrolase family protein [Chitinasiproducens palmae]SDV46827.1 2-keto-4-pentenoate hydratase/2-oxohepta-3-ene-1,7-dioic acid hydratase (catechol pathway) [Chitinasiproducens palmae]
MKFVTFEKDGQRRVGALRDDDRIVDLTPAVGERGLAAIIGAYASLAEPIAAAIETAKETFDVNDVTLRAPVDRPPRNVFCVGKNYHEHAHEFAKSGFDSSAAAGAVPAAPIIFSKPPTAVSGPYADIDVSLDPTGTVDYEAEFAVVIGKAGRCTDADDPWSFVFGYTLVNDVTSRELQKHHSQWLLGKGIDGFCPMGPALLTRDELPVLDDLEITCEVNGEVRQRSPLKNLIFDIPTLIRTIGRSISFEPGDVIATGTPAGVGIGFKPPKYLKPGDIVTVAMSPIGALRNRVV